MFYKIIKNNMIIDVNNVFLSESQKNHILTEASYEHAHFIISSDRKQLYKTSWCNGLENSAYQAEFVNAEFIDESEFNQLKEQLQNNVVEYVDKKEGNVEIITENTQETEVLDMIAMKKKILELEALVAQLLQK